MIFCKKTKSIFGWRPRGAYLPAIMMSSVLLIAFATAMISISISNLKLTKVNERSVSNLEVAEAGVNYYMWHLSHDNSDYCDGGVCAGEVPFGPFTHEYQDPSGKILGSYDLYITPPTLGETSTTVRSVGRVNNSLGDRTVTAELGMPSFARYAFLIGAECWFAENQVTNGPVHSNVGVRFDGTANEIVSASNATYVPSSEFGGDGQSHNGVWGSGGPVSYWMYPMPTVDFNIIGVDFINLRAESDQGGIHYIKSNSLGYYIHLRTDNKIDVYRVSRERTNGITSNFIETREAPANGIVYVEDNVWVDGTYDGRVTIVAHSQTGGQPNIRIKDNLLYSAKDGTDAIGLVAEGDVDIPMYAPNDIEIDGALLAATGHVWYPISNGSAVKNRLELYGGLASFREWTWTWKYGQMVTSGYRYTFQTQDPYLALNPPPEFPTTGVYSILSWREE